MPSAVATIAEVHRAAATLRATRDAGAVRVAEALDLWLAGATLDTALGLAQGWREAVRVRARDDAVDAVARHFPELRGRPLAKAVEQAINRYSTPQWPRDREVGRRPNGLNGAAYDFLTVSHPLSADRIRKLIADRNGLPTSLSVTQCQRDLSDMEMTHATAGR